MGFFFFFFCGSPSKLIRQVEESFEIFGNIFSKYTNMGTFLCGCEQITLGARGQGEVHLDGAGFW